jgi:5-methyltetrahydropteroyltriglutamate--homocysteine methyltransferase
MTKIKTTHVGSLPRSNELSDLLFKKDKKEKIDLDNFDAVVKKDVKKIVKKQVDLGIDFISDGEMSKISYATYVKDRIDGFSGEKVKEKLQKTLMIFQHLKNELQEVVELQAYTRPCCTNELKIKDTLSLTKDINNFKEALKENNHNLAFMNAASPGVISAFLPNKFYKNDDEYLSSLSKIMKQEYEEIVSNDIYLQLDCPDLALARHMTFKDLSEEIF